MTKSIHLQRGLALVLVFTAFVASALISRLVFERLPHLEDEVAYLYQARIFARGDVSAPAPDPYRPFWQPFIIEQDGQLFSKYTPGWSMVLSLGVLAGVPWVVNALCGGLVVAVTYRLGEELFSAEVGLLAAWLMTFSPMALLLNATLMSHTVALLYVMVFIYAYWRHTQGRASYRWALLAGLALGALAVTRMLTAVAVVAPFLLDATIRLWAGGWRAVRPLVVFGVGALVLLPVVPGYRYLVTGDPLQNTYLLVWEYDRIGFGPDTGRDGHSLRKGLFHARNDLSLTAADLFGWQWGALNAEQRQHLLTSAYAYPGVGLSLVLLPLGMLLGAFSGRWRWALLLAAVPLALVGAHLAYWIGSQRYSTRYYYEALGAVALLSALPLGALVRAGWRRWLVWMVLVTLTLYSMVAYTWPRIALLHGFNQVERALIEEVNERRQTDRPVLVLMTGTDMTWRAGGALLAVTGPYLDTDIVLARNHPDGRHLQRIYEMFPHREIIPMEGTGEIAWFADDMPSPGGVR